MNAIERLKRARNLDEVASEIEPLAQALAAISDETRRALVEQSEAHSVQAQAWAEQQKAATRALNQAAQQLQAAAEASMAAANGVRWRLTLLSVLTGAAAAGLTTVLSLWLPTLMDDAKRQREIGQAVEARWQTLTTEQRAELQALMGWE